jgi:hypothetical protein
MEAPVSIEVIVTGIVLVGVALVIFFVLKRVFGRKKVPPPPTPPGPYENDKDDESGEGLPWP